MNAHAIHNAVSLGLQSGDSALYPTIKYYEIDFEFSRCALKLLAKKYYPRGNKYGKGYEDTFIRDAGTEGLEREYTATPFVIDSGKVGIALPPDFLYYIQSETSMWYNRCSSLSEATATDDEYVIKLPFNSSAIYTSSSIGSYTNFDIIKASTTRTAFAADATVVNGSDQVTVTGHGFASPYFFVKFHGVTYFVTAVPGANTLTLDRDYEGANETIPAADADTGSYGILSIISTAMKNMFQYYVYPTDEHNFVTDIITDVTDNYVGSESLYWEDYKTVKDRNSFVVASSSDPEIFAIKYDNSNYMAVTSEALQTTRVDSVTGSAGTRKSQNRLIKKQYLRTLLNNPLRKPRVDSPAGNIEDGKLILYRDSSFAAQNVVLNYIKYPKHLALKTGSVPELGANLLEEVIEETVSSLLERYRSERYQSHTVQTNKSE